MFDCVGYLGSTQRREVNFFSKDVPFEANVAQRSNAALVIPIAIELMEDSTRLTVA